MSACLRWRSAHDTVYDIHVISCSVGFIIDCKWFGPGSHNYTGDVEPGGRNTQADPWAVKILTAGVERLGLAVGPIPPSVSCIAEEAGEQCIPTKRNHE